MYHENTDKIELVYYFEELEEGLCIHDFCTERGIVVSTRRSSILTELTNCIRVLASDNVEHMVIKLSI